MAIVSVPPFWYPTFVDPSPTTSNPSISSTLMNASGDRVGMVVVCPKSGTLDKAELLLSAVGNNPDNGLRISFQTVDAATGLPDTVVDQFRDVTGAISAGWLVPGLMTDDGTNTGVKRTVTAGEKIAVVVDFVSFVASDSVSVGHVVSISSWTGSLSNYVADASTGTYNKPATQQPIVALKYDDGTYAYPCTGGLGPITTITATNVNTGSTPDEYAVAFQMPFKVRVVGLWARIDANEGVELIMYDGTTAEETITIDKDTIQSTVPGLVMGYFDSSYECSAATTYRIGIKPTTATNIQVLRLTFPSADLMDAASPGSDWFESSRTDAGAWSDTTTNRPIAGLIIDGIDIPAGGGGGGGSFTFVG